MEFKVRGIKLNLPDKLIEEYLNKKGIPEQFLEGMIDLHYRRAKNNPDKFGDDINTAVEASIRGEIALWERKPLSTP